MLIGCASDSYDSTTWVAGSGYTSIIAGGYYNSYAEYRIVSATQSGVAVSCSCTSNQTWGIIADAVKQASAAPVVAGGDNPQQKVAELLL